MRINDRGPFVRGRIIDLSKAAKNEIQMGGTADVRIEIYNPEEESRERERDEENPSPVNLFEEEYPSTSKIFVEWIKDQTNEGDISEEQMNQIFNSSKIKIKVLTADVAGCKFNDLSGNCGKQRFQLF